jgi:hypothetical protein
MIEYLSRDTKKMDSLFDWKETIQITPEYHEFEDCVLKRRIGPLSAGTRVGLVVLNLEEGEISLCDDAGDEIWTGRTAVNFNGDRLEFVSPKAPEEVNVLVFNYESPTLRAPFDVFQKNKTLKNILIDYAHGGDVELETLDGTFVKYPLSIDVL